MQIQSIPLAGIVDAPHQPRRQRQVDDLVESMRAIGLLQPVVVRPHGAVFELVAGHRRAAAARALGWEAVDAHVLDLGDADAMAATIAENLQREGISALEEAAAVAQLWATGMAPARIAAALGRTVAWVRARHQIDALSPAWRSALDDAGHRCAGIPVELLAVIARLPDSAQDRLLDELPAEDGWPSPAAFTAWIEKHYLHELSAAPWDLDDAALVGGACATCAHRTSCQQELWETRDRTEVLGRCLDAACWAAKNAEHLATRITAAREKHADLVLAGAGQSPLPGEEQVPVDQLAKARKSDPAARPVLLTTGAKAGEIVYMAPQPWAIKEVKQAFAAPPPPADPGQALEARRRRLEDKRRRWITTRVAQFLAEKRQAIPAEIADQDLLGLLVGYGIEVQQSDALEPPAVRLAVWTSICDDLAQELNHEAANGAAQGVDLARVVMGDIGYGFQFDLFRQQAEQEVPTPKALAQAVGQDQAEKKGRG